MRRSRHRRMMTVLAGALLAGPGVLVSTAADASAAPALSRAEMEQYLESAKVVARKPIPEGVTHPWRLTLDDGQRSHDAHQQTVDIHEDTFTGPLGTEINFRDCYRYNIAAYRLDRLLGMNMIPVSVERRVGRRTGAVTWWVDDVLMREKERYLNNIEPPDQQRWNEQMYRVRLFNELIYNMDANLGNLLITNDWDIWIIDFTRAFRLHESLRKPENLTRIDRQLLERLRQLDRETLMRELRPYLRKNEINGLLARRDRIVDLFDRRIAENGEAAVLSEAPLR